MFTKILSASLVSLSIAGAAEAGCRLTWSDNNRNGVGSIQGWCSIDRQFETYPGNRPSLQIVVYGREYGESRTILFRNQLPYNGGQIYFDDNNRNGEGTVRGNFNIFEEDFQSRVVEVVAFIDGRAVRLYSGRPQTVGGVIR